MDHQEKLYLLLYELKEWKQRYGPFPLGGIYQRLFEVFDNYEKERVENNLILAKDRIRISAEKAAEEDQKINLIKKKKLEFRNKT